MDVVENTVKPKWSPCPHWALLALSGEWGKELILNEKDAEEAEKLHKQRLEFHRKVCMKCGKCSNKEAI